MPGWRSSREPGLSLSGEGQSAPAAPPSSRLIEPSHVPQAGPEETLNVRTNLVEVVQVVVDPLM